MVKLKIARKIFCSAAFLSILFSIPVSAVSQISSNAQMGFSVEVPEAISITIPSTAPEISFTEVSKNGSFGYTALEVTVGLNKAYRYTLSMYSTSGATDSASLKNDSYSLSTLSSNQTVSSLTTGAGWTTLNTWGYAVGSTSDASWTFKGVGGSSSAASIIHNPSDSSAQATNGITTNVILGTKIDLAQAYGDYSTTLTFIALAEPQTLASISTMQEMTSEICAATPTPLASDGASTPQYQLRDTRDNKYYYVAKLADGNCWMTQDLDLVLSTTTTLTPADSDVSANWTPNQNTQTIQYKESDGTTHSEARWTSDYNTTARSYRPASDVVAGTSGSYGYFDDTYYSPVIMINGTTMSSYKTEAECVAGGNSAENCAHWNVGTFYSWYAATAGTGNANVSIDGQNVSDSICPAGWRLPTGTSTGEFQALITAGSIAASTITGAPYYFLYSGEHGGYDGAVGNTGVYGYYWSSTSCSDSGSAYNLRIRSSSINTSSDFNRESGLNIRCVADS